MYIGPSEILLIVILGILLFGPEKLPSIARELGKIYAQANTALRQLQEAFYAPIREESRKVKNVVEELKQDISQARSDIASATSECNCPTPSLEVENTKTSTNKDSATEASKDDEG